MPERIALGIAIANGDLRHGRQGEALTTGADLVGALAACSAIGSLLVRFFDAHDASAYSLIEALLDEHLGPRHPHVNSLAIAQLALHEWTFPNCQTCEGKGEIRDLSGVCRQCFVCDGSGVRRYSDGERARFTGGARWNRASGTALNDAMAIITGQYRQCKSAVGSQLSDQP